MEVVRHWRQQERMRMGPGRKLFSFGYRSGLKEDGGYVRELRVTSKLLRIDMNLRQEGGSVEYMLGLASRFVDEIRGKKVVDEVIEKLAFGVSMEMGGDGGEEFVQGVMGELGHEEACDHVGQVKRMAELGFGKSDAGNWLFSVNGYCRNDEEDEIAVGGMLEEAFEGSEG